MKNIEDFITPFIKQQFPSFYVEEGPLFIEFVKSYFKWLQSSNQQLFYSRNLLEYKDIDKTIDSFIVHFKETYLVDLPLVKETNERLFVKNVLDLYQNKGNERSIKLALRALYNVDSAVYLPSVDIFKSSSGKWIKPKYLELSKSNRNLSFVNKQIVGTISGSKAFVESVVSKRVKGKIIDVAYLSNLSGNFLSGEKIVEVSNTNVLNAPTMIGSLTSLEVLNGGQNFSIGDEFEIISENGRDGLAIVTSISNETGRVNFVINDGGWGYSNTANVFISDKVIGFKTLTNSNSSISEFERFETVSQNLMSVGFTSAINSNYFNANTILFAQGNSSVSNATAGIVSVSLVSNTEGIVKVTNLSGNIAATNSVFKASLVDLVFDTASNISLFANGLSIEAVNATANANAYIISATSSNSSHGTLLLRPVTGNVSATNTTFRLVTNTATTATVNTYTANLYFTAVVANNADITANGFLIGQNSTHFGLDSVLNTFIPNTIFSFVRGLTSNSYANITFVSSGTDANFKIGSLDLEEQVFFTPDLLSANNTGNVPFVDINLDLSPNNANATGYGFVKFPGADENTILLDVLRYVSTSIGTIKTLASINPGTDYNINPFVLVYEKDVAGYKRKDFVIEISSLTGLFKLGEKVKQTVNVSAVELTVNNFSGTAANGTSTSTFEIGEYVYQSNGSANIATGFVVSAGISGGNGTVLLRDVSGAFQNTNINGYQLNTLTTGGTANISSTNTSATIATTAYGLIDEGSNSSVLNVKRISFENTFGVGNTLIGITSGATATIDNVYINSNKLPIGENADISGNVQVANAVVSGLDVIDSGFGYLNRENVSLEKSGSVFIVTAQTRVVNQGESVGYYDDSGGFLSSDKKLHDNDYYQEYSYEIQTKVPFSKYADILKKVVHVAGTKMFGKILIDSTTNTQILTTNNQTRLLDLKILNSTSGKTFVDNELLVFSNGNSNLSLTYVTSNALSYSITNNQDIVVIEVPDSNNAYVIDRPVYMPNANSYVASGNLVAKTSNNTSNVTILYIANSNGTFTSSNTISGHVSSNVSNTTTTGTTLSHAVLVYGYGNVNDAVISTVSIPVSETLSSSLTGTVSVSNTSVNVTGTSTTFNTDFANDNFIFIQGATSNVVVQIKSVTNATHMILREFPSFTNSSSVYFKSFSFIANTPLKMPNASSNVAFANLFNYTSNQTHFTYFLNNVYGSFEDSNTVEGYINSSTTNTYTLSYAINTLVASNTENDLPTNNIVTGVSSNASANVSYLTVRLEK